MSASGGKSDFLGGPPALSSAIGIVLPSDRMSVIAARKRSVSPGRNARIRAAARYCARSASFSRS